MIVHDMRGLMTVVLANLELARPDITGDAAVDVDAAVRAAQDVTHMSNTLLDVSRLEEGKMPLNRAPRDLAALAKESRDSMRALDTSRTIRVVAAGPVLGFVR